jgi:hypothetical protein
VRRIDRCRAQCPLDHVSNLIVFDSSRPARARLVQQTITAILRFTPKSLAIHKLGRPITPAIPLIAAVSGNFRHCDQALREGLLEGLGLREKCY